MRIKRSRIPAVQEALDEVEAALQEVGSDLQFLVTPEGGLEIARRTETGVPLEPKQTVARLEGCDPVLWQAERPEGPISLGPPYRDAGPRCALSGRELRAGAPVELYYRGRPVSPERASRLAPLLTLVRGVVAAAASLLDELLGASARLQNVDNAELRAIMVDRLALELAGRLGPGAGGAPAGAPRESMPADAAST